MIRKTRVVFYTVCGHAFMVLGGIGMVLPVLPTTPFIILAFGCYMKGSKRFRKMLLQNPYLGQHIREWTRHGSIPLKAKVIAVAMIWLSIMWSVYVVPLPPVRWALVAIGIAVSLYIATRPLPMKWRRRSSREEV